MTETSQAARRLKLLRERAGLSMRAVSEALGWTLTRYQHYEDRYRRPYLPLVLAGQLAENAAAERMKLLASTDPRKATAAASQYLARYPSGFARAAAESILHDAH